MPNWLIDLIEQHSTIVLFRHVFPDMDALGSQLGFSLWLKNRYPQKQIYCLGQNNSLSDKLGFQMDEVTEDVLKERIESHCINYEALVSDDFHTYLIDRAKKILGLIEKAMGKPVSDRDADTTVEQFGEKLV